MRKSKSRQVARVKRGAIDKFLCAWSDAEDGAVTAFKEAVRQQMPSVIEKAISQVASHAIR